MSYPAFSNKRVHPITGAISGRTVTEEFTISELSDDLPGVYGVQLSGSIVQGTLTVTENNSGAAVFTEVTTEPLAGQVAVRYSSGLNKRGLLIFNVADDGTDVVVEYDDAGTINSRQNTEAVASAAGEAVVDSAIGSLPVAVSVIRDAGDTDHDLEFTFLKRDGTTEVVTKQLDATWAAGDNAGGMYSGDSLPTSGVVWCWGIRSGAGALDVVGTDSATAPTLSGALAGYSFVSPKAVARRLTDSSANFRAFYQSVEGGFVVMTDTLALDVDTTQGTTRAAHNIVNAPPECEAFGRKVAGITGSVQIVKFEHSAHTDQAPADTAALGFIATNVSSAAWNHGDQPFLVDSSRQIAIDATAAGVTVRVQVYGWRERVLL